MPLLGPIQFIDWCRQKKIWATRLVNFLALALVGCIAFMGYNWPGWGAFSRGQKMAIVAVGAIILGILIVSVVVLIDRGRL